MNETAGGTRSPDKRVHAGKRIVQDMIRSIDVAADFEDSTSQARGTTSSGRRTWVAIKVVSLIVDYFEAT